MKKLSTIFKTLASVSKPPALYNAQLCFTCLLAFFCLFVVCGWFTPFFFSVLILICYLFFFFQQNRNHVVW